MAGFGNRISGLLAGILVIWVLCGSAFADEQRVALVIGNAAYSGAPLKNPVNDAADITVKLGSLGFAVVERRNLTTKQIGGTLREFRAKLQPGAVAIVFYAGHGLQIKGENYLPAVDAEINSEEDVPNQSLAVRQIMDVLEDAKTRVNLVFLDACRNNPYARSFRSTADGLARMNAPSGTLISFATRPGSVAADGRGRNGLYTEQLLRQMDEANVPIEQVLKRVLSGVKAVSAGKQEPWMEGSLEGDFYFRWTTQGTQTASLVPVPATPAPAAAPGRPSLPVPVASDDPAGPRPGTILKDCAECPEMVVIPAGSFDMGSPSGEAGRYDDEGPQHRVSVSTVALAKTHVTRGQFAAFVKETRYQTGGNCWEHWKDYDRRPSRNWKDPGYPQQDSHPAVCLNWNDAKAYTEWLGRKTGKRYRLPTESEWEYAARAGTATARYWGESPDQACSYANVLDSTGKARVPVVRWDAHNCTDGYAYTAPVASFKANAYGLYDMIGNAWQWTEDCYHENYAGAPTDGSAWTGGECKYRVLRGGSWGNDLQLARSATRIRNRPEEPVSDHGFRPARMLP